MKLSPIFQKVLKIPPEKENRLLFLRLLLGKPLFFLWGKWCPIEIILSDTMGVPWYSVVFGKVRTKQAAILETKRWKQATQVSLSPLGDYWANKSHTRIKAWEFVICCYLLLSLKSVSLPEWRPLSCPSRMECFLVSHRKCMEALLLSMQGSVLCI